MPDAPPGNEDSGPAPAAAEWFVVNVRDAEWRTWPSFGAGADFETCGILVTGARTRDKRLFYPKSELAARFGASATAETSDPKQAYAPFEHAQRTRPRYWKSLPWA